MPINTLLIVLLGFLLVITLGGTALLWRLYRMLTTFENET